MYILFFLAGFFFGSKTLSFAAAIETLPKNNSGSAVGFMNTLVMSGGVIFLPLVGILLNVGKDSSTTNSMEQYTITDFRFALSVIPICMLLALIIIITTKETYPKDSSSPQSSLPTEDSLINNEVKRTRTIPVGS